MVVGNFIESTEAVVIGAGPGGYVAAIRLAQLGKEVTLISKDPVPGGVCLLAGCIPSKALLEVTKYFEKIQKLSGVGIEVENAKLNWPQLQSWKDGKIKKLAQGTLQLLKQNGVNWIEGEARFKSPHSLEIHSEQGVKELDFKHAIMATGSVPRVLPGFEFDGDTILSSTEILKLQDVPKSMLIIGGGYIGLELAFVLARAGCKVTIIEAMEDLLPGTEKDLLRPLKKKLKQLGIDFFPNSKAQSYQKQSGGLEVNIQNNSGETQTLTAEKILVAIGRTWDFSALQLDKAGIEKSERGFLKVNSSLQTSVPHIYAIGDAIGGKMLAHKASFEGKIAAANISGKKEIMEAQVPAVIFTDPEIAWVGLTESEAKENNLEVTTGLFSFAALGRGQTMVEDADGFVKIVAEKQSERILGVQMVGPHVAELISEATHAIEMGSSLEDLALTIHPHPTLSEAVVEAAESALGMPIHRVQRKS